MRHQLPPPPPLPPQPLWRVMDASDLRTALTAIFALIGRAALEDSFRREAAKSRKLRERERKN